MSGAPGGGAIPGIDFRDTAGGLEAPQLEGFFAGWRRAPSPAERLAVLRRSDVVVVAWDRRSGALVGFVTALTDGVLCASITLLEVLPSHRGRGIGGALVRRVVDRLGGLYALDVVCAPELLPFYASCGMAPGVAAVRRNYGAPAGGGDDTAEPGTP